MSDKSEKYSNLLWVNTDGSKSYASKKKADEAVKLWHLFFGRKKNA